ncbi:MAG: LptF/LptG family permease [Mucinivorans sp.]
MWKKNALKHSIKNLGSAMRLMILDRYIIKKFLMTYFFAIAMIIVVMVIFDASEKIDDFMSGHAPWSAIFGEYYLNFIPFFVNQFSSLFAFISVIFFTSKMAYDTEIIAILSSGVSFNRMMYPYFVAAFVITLLSLALNILIIPGANARRIAFERQYMQQPGQEESRYDRYIFRQLASSTFVFVRDFDGKSSTAGFLTVETYDGGRVVSSLQAASVKFNDQTGRWTAPQYTLRTYEGDRDTLLRSSEALDTLLNLTPDELGREAELIQTMDSFRLAKFIEAQKSKGSDMVAQYQVEAYGRYAFPISTFILTLIGVSLSSRKVRGGTGLHIGIGITLCFSYIVLMRFVGEFAKGGTLPVWLAIWLPNIIYLIIGVYLYRKAPK